MRISIVTPSYNLGKFISTAIESVENQDYFDKEHLIFDAKSTDCTIDILNKCEHIPHLKWVSEADNGQSDAINKGFKAASGDIVAWLNADDYYLPGTFSKVAEFFQENPKIDILYGDTMYVDQNNKFLRYKKDHRFDFDILFYYGCYIESTSTFFRKRIFDDGHLLNTDYRIAMDYEYYVRLAKLGYKFGYCPEVLGVFRWQGNNASLDHAKAYIEIRRAQRQAGLVLSNNPIFEKAAYQFLKEIHRIKRRTLRTLDVLSSFQYS